MYEFAISNIISSTICAHCKPHVQKEKYTRHLISQLEKQCAPKPQISISKINFSGDHRYGQSKMKGSRQLHQRTGDVPDKTKLIINMRSCNYQEHIRLNLQQLKNHHNYSNKLYIRMKLHRAKQLLLNLSPNSSNFEELSPDLHSGRSNKLWKFIRLCSCNSLYSQFQNTSHLIQNLVSRTRIGRFKVIVRLFKTCLQPTHTVL